VEDQPVVSVTAEGLGDDPFKLGFDLVDGLSGCQASAIADSEHMGVHGEGLFAERRVQNDVGGLAAHAWQLLKLFAGARDLSAMPIDQRLAQRDDILRLGIEQSDRLDRFAQGFFAQSDHLAWVLDTFEQRPAGDVHTGVRGLSRENHRNKQLVGIGGFEFGRRRGVLLG
jgi:hypothetical protein